ncbi:hypothetical protein MMIC_P0207 [Mariprofundus micogutta]|uniref:Cytidylyltransferase family protein n=1 Tax=Mariprofundus micogutta TaxID=1921010 RepID=A0A1L8CK24_9PROT|nr:hypothetical protein [Mariprofundus micogutta]GAV19274.1 hypothetical protein MMIC_P0207 [Mariprofundus micogutta]
MFEYIELSDLVLSALVIFGILQLAWFSVMIVRRGAQPQTIQQAIPPLLSIWVLMWPVYVESQWLWAGIAMLTALGLLSITVRKPFWQQLRFAWGRHPDDSKPAIYPSLKLMPLTHLITALLIAGLWFQAIPEFGFGLALCLCLAFPAAYWVDQLSKIKFHFLTLGFPAHPEQTLAGHLVLITTSTVLLCWSLHVYHGTDWQTLFIATLIASMTASATRAIIPGLWNTPAAMMSVGFVMWLL